MIIYILFIILLLPLIFQFIVGNIATKGMISLKFWQVSLISLVGQVGSAVFNLLFISEQISRSGSRNGLPFIAMLILELMIGSILLITILIQGYLQYRKDKFMNK